MKRSVLAATAVFLFVSGVLATRSVVSGKQALERGDAALTQGDTELAVWWWRRAARWYVPFAPHVDDAYSRITSVAEGADQSGDSRLSLLAWRAVRSSALATRTLWTPHEEDLIIANRRIAELMAAAEAPGIAPDETPAQRRGWHLEKLSNVVAPSALWTIVALLGLILWMWGVVYFVQRAVILRERIDKRFAARAGVMVFCGMALWLIGLACA